MNATENPGLTKPFLHFVDGELHTVYPATDGKLTHWVPIAKRARNEIPLSVSDLLLRSVSPRPHLSD